MRLNALEAIALIIREKVKLEHYQKKQDEIRFKRGGLVVNFREQFVWKNCQSIYKWLSHHYI